LPADSARAFPPSEDDHFSVESNSLSGSFDSPVSFYQATDIDSLSRCFSEHLSSIGLLHTWTLLKRDEAADLYRVLHSTDVVTEAWKEIALSPADPLFKDVGEGGVVLTAPGLSPYKLVWHGLPASVFGVIAFSRDTGPPGIPWGYLLLHGSRSIPVEAWPALRSMSKHYHQALERLLILEEYRTASQRSEDVLAAVNEMGALMGTLDLQVLLTKILELALRISDAEVGAVLLLGRGALESKVEWGITPAELLALKMMDGKTFVEATIESGRAEYVPNLYLDPRLDAGQGPLTMDSIVALPLATVNGPLGVICVVNVSEENGFSAERLSTLNTVSSLAATAVENARYHQEALENEKLKEQARIAEGIQKGFLPRRIPEARGFELAGNTVPAQFVGGDYYDFIALGPDLVGIAVADVSGHGISSGLVMSMTRALFRAEASKTLSPANLLVALNKHLTAEDLSGAFVTFIYAILETKKSEMVLASAGHTPLVHHHAASNRVQILGDESLPLGLFEDAAYSELVVKIDRGDTLLLMTDGLIEAMNSSRLQFGYDRVGQILCRHANGPVAEVIESLRAGVFSFTSPGSPHDDVTTVVIRAKGDQA
jgi:sigma-B regulation protein RsbU (phosphoserine phosphatase)